jgi:quinol monooxygenase YgiN
MLLGLHIRNQCPFNHPIGVAESTLKVVTHQTCQAKERGEIMTLTIEVRAKPERVNELYQTLQAIIPTMRQEKGCLNCRISQDMEDGENYVLSSDWDAEASFGGYIKSNSGIALLGAINLLGQSTRVQVGSGAKWEGAEALKRIWRSSQ